MKQRVLTRKVIIREYDFQKLKDVATRPMSCMGIKDSLYDRVSFMPLDQHNLEKLKVIDILKGKKHTPLSDVEWNYQDPNLLLYHLRDYLYNVKYYDWRVTVDDEGFICVQSRANTPKSRIGWGVFEKDVTCRI